MARVRLVQLNRKEAAPIQELLQAAGFEVEYDFPVDSALLRKCRENPPTLFVIDLSRMPSHGREVAIALRQSPKTRQIPIVFCNAAPEKEKLIRAILPDADYSTGESLVETLRKVRPVERPIKPPDMMNRYGSRTTAQKLGVSEQSTIAVVDPPRNLSNILGEVPGQVEFVEKDGDVTLCFVHSVDDLRSDVSRVRGLASKTKLWILWRKKSASAHDGVTETLVRETGIDLGLVDYKICSIDSTWSAMLFAQRKKKAASAR